MAFTKYTAEVILTTELPTSHNINYTDFNIYRKFDDVNKKYVLDDNKFKNYFNEPFINKENILSKNLAGDNINIDSSSGFINLKFKRDWFGEVDYNEYKYAKIKLFFDETKYEEFYCWINNIIIDNTQLVYLKMKLTIDLIPTNYESIKKQYYTTVITRRSFNVWKSKNNYEDERQLRLNRFSWNISCDNLCQASHYHSHIIPLEVDRYVVDNPAGGKMWGEKKEIRGMFIFNLSSSTSADANFYNSIEKFTDPYNVDFKKSLQPASIPQPPIFLLSIYNKNIPPKDETSGYLNFSTYGILRDYVYNYLRDDKLLKVIFDGVIPESKPSQILNIFLYPYNKEIDKKERDFKTYANTSLYTWYNQPLHYLQYHTKYSVIGNQDELGEISNDYIFLEGYDYLSSINSQKWIDAIPLKIYPRITTENVVLDVYPTQWIPSAVQNKDISTKVWDITPALSLDFWVKIYPEEDALSKYLRSSQEQRKLQKQQARNAYIKKGIGSVLGGAIAGATAGAKITAIGGVPGMLAGAILGIIGFFVSEHILNLSPEQQELNKQQDIANSFTPSIPSNLGGDYIFGNTPTLTEYHPLGVGVLIISAYGWEDNLEISNIDRMVDSKRMLNNLINFGEKCEKYFKEFNFFEFVANNKTDQEVFYLVGEQSVPKNQLKWSNIFENLPETFAQLMQTGLRFHFKE